MEDLLDSESIPIGANIHVKFDGIRFSKIRSRLGKRFHIMKMIFSEVKGVNILSKDMWQTDLGVENSFDHWEYAGITEELYEVLSGKKLSDSIPVNKKNWIVFYENYINIMKPFSGTECYIKTIPNRGNKGYGENKKIVMTADLPSKNFICLTPDLTYTILEENIAQDYIETKEVSMFDGLDKLQISSSPEW